MPVRLPAQACLVALLSHLCLSPGGSPAHADEWLDVVYLKNGGVVRGVIVEQRPNQSLRVETRDGSVLIFKLDEVDRFGKERASAQPTKVEPARVEPAKVEPAKVEPAKVEPAKVEPAKVEPAKVEPTRWSGRRLGLGGSIATGLSYLQYLGLAGRTNTLADVVLVPLELTVGLRVASGEDGPEHLVGLTFRQIFVASGGVATSNLDIFARYRYRHGLFSVGGGVGLDTGSGGTLFALTGHAGLELRFTSNLGFALDLLSFTSYLGSARTLAFHALLGPTARFFF